MESIDDYLELNDFEVRTEDFMGSQIYYIDNFYKYPDQLISYLHNQKCPLHKSNQTPSHNGVFFEDRRHAIKSEKIIDVSQVLADICGHSVVNRKVFTNFTRFKRCSFNNFDDNYWWPHRDHGYTGIVYFNSSATNLYEKIEYDGERSLINEHYKPWRSKQKYKILKTLESKYNRLVLFEGKKFIHGMSITDDTYFGSEYRTNQAIFLSNE